MSDVPGGKPPSPVQLRGELPRRVIADLHGRVGGPEEEADERGKCLAPSGRPKAKSRKGTNHPSLGAFDDE